MAEEFKQRLEIYSDNAKIIEQLFRCEKEEFASSHCERRVSCELLNEAISNLDGLHRLAEEMIKHMESSDD